MPVRPGSRRPPLDLQSRPSRPNRRASRLHLLLPLIITIRVSYPWMDERPACGAANLRSQWHAQSRTHPLANTSTIRDQDPLVSRLRPQGPALPDCRQHDLRCAHSLVKDAAKASMCMPNVSLAAHFSTNMCALCRAVFCCLCATWRSRCESSHLLTTAGHVIC